MQYSPEMHNEGNQRTFLLNFHSDSRNWSVWMWKWVIFSGFFSLSFCSAHITSKLCQSHATSSIDLYIRFFLISIAWMHATCFINVKHDMNDIMFVNLIFAAQFQIDFHTWNNFCFLDRSGRSSKYSDIWARKTVTIAIVNNT